MWLPPRPPRAPSGPALLCAEIDAASCLVVAVAVHVAPFSGSILIVRRLWDMGQECSVLSPLRHACSLGCCPQGCEPMALGVGRTSLMGLGDCPRASPAFPSDAWTSGGEIPHSTQGVCTARGGTGPLPAQTRNAAQSPQGEIPHSSPGVCAGWRRGPPICADASRSDKKAGRPEATRGSGGAMGRPRALRRRL